MTAHNDEFATLVIPRARLAKRPPLSRLAQRRALRLTLLASDSLMLALAFRLAFWLRFELGLTMAPEIVPSPDYYPRVVLILIPVWLGIFALFKLYDYDHLLGGTGEYASVFNGCTVGMMLVITTAFVEPALVVSRGWLLMAWGLASCWWPPHGSGSAAGSTGCGGGAILSCPA